MLEGWTEIMFYVMDAHSFWSFVILIPVTIVSMHSIFVCDFVYNLQTNILQYSCILVVCNVVESVKICLNVKIV